MSRPTFLRKSQRTDISNGTITVLQCFVDLTGHSVQICPRCDHMVNKSTHNRFRSYSHLGDLETMRIFRIRYNNYYCNICRPAHGKGRSSFRKFEEDLSWVSPGGTSYTWAVYSKINDYFKELENRYSISRYMWKFHCVNISAMGISEMRRRRLKYKRHYKIPPEHMWVKWNDDEVLEWNKEEHGSPYTNEKIRDNKFWVNFDRNKENEDEA